ncbi:MAG: FKBP-type peptidyl-prolyl cis-trans isomerase [Akkermansiaceae bacterium]|jgi:FKBP-type peptidyl-prolyl cis-trans isomerase FklB
MKIFLLTPLFFIGTLSAQEAEEKPTVSSEEAIRQSSLALGYQEGIRTSRKQMRTEDINTDAYLEGFLRGLKGQKISLSPEEIRDAMTLLQAKITAREIDTAEANLQAAKEFLQAKESKEGIIKNDSGLLYRVVKAGEGEPFGEEGLFGKEILVNYRGTLPDGTEFATSGELTPAIIQLDDVITGFREALLKMRKGDKWVAFVPSELAYGDQRRSSEIGPNQLLIFEIELVEVRAIPLPTE